MATTTEFYDAQRIYHRAYLLGSITREKHAAMIDELDARIQTLYPRRTHRVRVLGRDAAGYIVARTIDGPHVLDIRLTECCLASAKGMSNFVGCRACYRPVDSAIGGMPEAPYRDHEGLTSAQVAGWDGPTEAEAAAIAKALRDSE
jgi:hypothetical protein